MRRAGPVVGGRRYHGRVATALYRRYRPESFSEMIGQEQVTAPLMTALRSERIGHAYLFSGPRGCGKTTSARILARCLNCAEGPTDTPCGVCPSCVELSRAGGGSLDVVEIDAASHGGVDDARDLRERAVFAPARDRYKIFIIDEAHMVTAGGFNALLKIVEEPPPHVKFIFATTEPEKVIGTIRSRTHHYPFRLIAPATLIEYVQSLCDSEQVEVEPGVLPLVVRAGGGSVRDTLSILDQLIAGSEGNRVTAERATGLLGYTPSELIDEVVVAIGAADSAAAFRAVDRVVQTGQDPRRFVEDMLERLRDLIVISATTVQGASAVFRGVPEDQLQRMFEQAQVFAPGRLSRIADTVSESLDRMVGATAPRLHLELMIARALVAEAPAAGSTNSAGQAAEPQMSLRAAITGQTAPAAPQRAASAPTTAQAPVAAPAPTGARPAQQPNGGTAAQQPPVETAEAPAPAAQPAPVSAAPSAPAAPANAAQTARAVREFLREDSAGAAPFGRPVSDVLAGVPREPLNVSAEPSAPAPPAAPTAPAAASRPAQPAAPAPVQGPVGDAAEAGSDDASADESGEATLDDLTEIWPDLLEELLEGDRDAWNAVREITPLGLDGDVLSLGFPSKSSLDVFKTAGAGPLREAILSAVGVQVRYQPKQLPAGASPRESAPSSTGEGGAPQRSSTPDSDDSDPHRAGSVPSAEPARPEPEASRPGAEPAPAGAEPAPAAAPENVAPSPEPIDRAPTPAADPTPAKQAAAGPVVPAPAPGYGDDPYANDDGMPSDDDDGEGDPYGDPYADRRTVPAAAPQTAAPAAATEAPGAAPAQLPEDRASSRLAALASAMAARESAPTTAPAPSNGAPAHERPAPMTEWAAPSAPDAAAAEPAPAPIPAAPEREARVEAPPVRSSEPQAAAGSGSPERAPSRVGFAAAGQSAAAPKAPAAEAAIPGPGIADPDTGPELVRYGEAVVREVLGARFVEERPLPGQPES